MPADHDRLERGAGVHPSVVAARAARSERRRVRRRPAGAGTLEDGAALRRVGQMRREKKILVEATRRTNSEGLGIDRRCHVAM
jgi:hypothetical protein